MKRAFAIALLIAIADGTKAANVGDLWDFSNPQLSEQRFRQALDDAQGDSALILQTQIARTYSLREDFHAARDILSRVSAKLSSADSEVRVRYSLEMGRTYASAAHGSDVLTAENLRKAREFYLQAYETGIEAGLDGLAIDALHMMAFVDTDPADQLAWANRALAVARSSDDGDAKKWEASLVNNAGVALYRLQRFEEALAEFEVAVVLREKGTDPWATHVAQWMVAWTLRALERTQEAVEIQLRLEREREAAGRPDVFVLEELEKLYRALGNDARANHYAEKVEGFSK